MAFETVNPATGEKLRSAAFATESEIELAVSKLHRSYLRWSQINYPERQKVIQTIASNLNSKKEFFAALMSKEMGKPIRESRLEVTKCIQTIDNVAKMDLSFLYAKETMSIYNQSQIIHSPLGVIYSIMPWNFPLWQVVRMVIPALISGNTVLLKHSEITSETGDEFEKILKDVWDEPLLFHRMVQHDQTEKILKDPRIQGVSLTGSTQAGMAVAKAAAGSIKKFVLELGGSDPYLVLDDAPLAQAAKLIARSRLMNTGQSCICAKRCLVSASRLDSFIDLLKKEFESYQFGDPMNVKTDLGPLAHPRFKKGLENQIAELKSALNPKLIFQKKPDYSAQSAYVSSEIYLLNGSSSWLKDQEFFAPVLLVIPFKTDGEAVEIANSTDFALGGGVWTSDLERGKKVAGQMIAGQLAINDMIKSDLSLPFGGFKKSGVGRELGQSGFFEFTQTKVISSSL